MRKERISWKEGKIPYLFNDKYIFICEFLRAEHFVLCEKPTDVKRNMLIFLF